MIVHGDDGFAVSRQDTLQCSMTIVLDVNENGDRGDCFGIASLMPRPRELSVTHHRVVAPGKTDLTYSDWLVLVRDTIRVLGNDGVIGSYRLI
ncbi:hypothetical protein [Chloroflexus aggregans]|nr:hypothetical protein [Chloroflexus aggregans]